MKLLFPGLASEASFSPICLEISRAALAVDIGWLQPLWAALAPTLGLTIFLAMLPTASWLHVNAFASVRVPFNMCCW